MYLDCTAGAGCKLKGSDILFSSYDIILSKGERAMKQAGIYQIKNTINGKIYVGSSVDLRRRFREHRRLLLNNTHHSIILQNAVNCYGIKSFIFETIELCSPNNLITREQYYIDSLNPAYNVCKVAGNTLGREHTAKSKNKMSVSKKGKPGTRTGAQLSQETKNKIAKSHLGKPSWNKGKTHSPDTINKMKVSHSGQKAWNEGIPCSDKTKKNISNALQGRPAWNKGISRSEETKAKISKTRRERYGKNKPN
jgi:group I intron endonuclease